MREDKKIIDDFSDLPGDGDYAWAGMLICAVSALLVCLTLFSCTVGF